MSIAILITTYNSPLFLQAVLESVVQQSLAPTQVIIVDDGSLSETRDLVESFRSTLPVIYCWLPDKSFRAARARNLGLLKATTEYLVMIDGDCLLPPKFLEMHFKLKHPRKVVSGGRNLLSQTETALVMRGLDKLNAKSRIFSGFKFWSLPLGMLRDIRPKEWPTVRTCNLGLSTSTFISAGGFDETFEGWGEEDSDFILRLINYGINIRSARLAACVDHLHHEERVTKQSKQEKMNRLKQLAICTTQILPKKSVLKDL